MHEQARIVLPVAHAISLENVPPGGRKALAQHAEKRQRRLDAITEEQDDAASQEAGIVATA